MYCFTTNQENLLARMGNRLIDLAKRRRTEKGKRIAEGNESIQNSPIFLPPYPKSCHSLHVSDVRRWPGSGSRTARQCAFSPARTRRESQSTKKRKREKKLSPSSIAKKRPHLEGTSIRMCMPFPFLLPQMSVSLSWVSSPPPYAHPWHACFSKGEKKRA